MGATTYTYYLGLGTNLGDKEQNILRAVEKITEQIGKVVSRSALYATHPWGFESENTFLNAACCVETTFSPLDMLHATQQIERELGRVRKSQNGVYHDRLIDIDLLLCFDEQGTPIIYNTHELTIPHPLMWEREFVTVPLQEILPK